MSLTIFPRVNLLKAFETRFDQRVLNGRIYTTGQVTVVNH